MTKTDLNYAILVQNITFLFVDHTQNSEYCAFDTFKAQCDTDNIILITHARYGAMQIGKCIEMGIGELHLLTISNNKTSRIKEFLSTQEAKE